MKRPTPYQIKKAYIEGMPIAQIMQKLNTNETRIANIVNAEKICRKGSQFIKLPNSTFDLLA